MRTLTIDIGGTGLKMLPVDAAGQPLADRHRELTPKPATPDAVLETLKEMIRSQEPFDRVSVGFPGVVMHGIVKTAPNLGTEDWSGFDLATALATATGKPTRVINDAELQGYGVIEARGVEMVLTLGTGLGSALYIDGHLVPNLELGHHPLKADKSYEELVGEAALDEIGKKRWRKRVEYVLVTIQRIFNCDLIHIGGGNAKKLKPPLPDNVRLFQNVHGLRGGVRLWSESVTPAKSGAS